MSVIKWEPFSPRPFFFDLPGFLEDLPSSGSNQGLDIYETEGAVVVEASVPGISAEELKVSLDNGVLTISGDHLENEDEAGEKHAVYKTSRQASFRYATTLPREVEEGVVTAKLAKGVVKIILPKAEDRAEKATEIAIETE